ncbi:MAG: hemagglutinin [Saprospiraceae bacterium]|nr:glucosaminidase domain-containing protein [Bacteroidia bacterium]NNK89462.1 hemagglutinin [Saprospiraceae bacterium]
MLRSLIVAFIVYFALVSYKENPSTTYISQYKEIAISEMHRTGIPASIKMAQALLESGAGQSSLAREANNHFGIKCGGSWNGGTYYLHDDDYNSKGQLIKSCFREFSSSFESFIAHSEFLVTQNRYAFLFNYDHQDYKAWAKGLKKAGYATDKAYPKKLINIIEKYQLYFLDDAGVEDFSPDLAMQDSEIATRKNKTHFEYPSYSPGDATETTIAQNKRSERKRMRSDSNKTYHIVGLGETLSEIAMIYSLEENALRLRNRIPKDAEPLKGERIHLRKKISLIKRPKFTRTPEFDGLAAQEDFIF